MDYQYLPVNPALSNYVRSVLVCGEFPDSANSDLPLFTKGSSALIYKVQDGSGEITLFGQSVPDETWIIDGDTTIICFFFHPFLLAPIFKITAQTLKQQPVPLNLWNPQKAIALAIQLLHSGSIKNKTDILGYFLLGQIHANHHLCEVIRYATDKMMQDTSPDVHLQLLKDLNLTERTFQRIFKKYVGITASEYRRICQFQFAFSQLKGGHFDKQTDVAYHNGYFDQSHYIRTFQEFTDTTPNEYLKFGLGKKSE